MTAFLTILAVLAIVVSIGYALLARGISWPLRPVRRAGGRSASRPRDSRYSPLPAPRRDALPLTAEQLGELLLTHPWESRAETPELAAMSVHENHGYCHLCPVCVADLDGLTAVAGVVLDALADAMAEEQAQREAARKAAQLPIVGVREAVAAYGDES